MQETQGQTLGQEDPLQEEMATSSSILAWKNPMDREAWWATVHGAERSRIRLSTHACTVSFTHVCPLECRGKADRGKQEEADSAWGPVRCWAGGWPPWSRVSPVNRVQWGLLSPHNAWWNEGSVRLFNLHKSTQALAGVGCTHRLIEGIHTRLHPMDGRASPSPWPLPLLAELGSSLRICRHTGQLFQLEGPDNPKR